LACDISNSLSLAEGVHLNFTKYNGRNYLVNISINLKLLYNRDDNDFGIFLYDGFPLNGVWYTDKLFRDLLNRLNNQLENKFSYERTYTYTTDFNDIELKNLAILENYFQDKEKFKRIKGKRLKNRIVMDANQIHFTNQLTYDGIDHESKIESIIPPSGN